MTNHIICCVLLTEIGERIYGGYTATAGSFPYQISLQYGPPFKPFIRTTCGGSILNQRWILTAGHCITAQIAWPFNHFYVKAGVEDLEEEGQFVRAKRTIVHPDYEGGKAVGPNDIALIELSHNLKLNSLVQPITLPKKNENFTGMATVSGWGRNGGLFFATYPRKLQTVDLPLITNEVCREAINNITSADRDYLDDNSNICTGPLTGKVSVCSGDSGGPLVVKRGDTIIQIGIVSWGTSDCELENSPSGVYTKVSSFIDFINDNIN